VNGPPLIGLVVGRPCRGPQEWATRRPPSFKPKGLGTYVLGQGMGTYVLGQGMGTYLIILPIYNREYIIRKSEQREIVMRCQSIPGLSEGVSYE
jgi:hypothetical protein